MLSDNTVDKKVNWWIRKQEDLAHIQRYHHNPSYLSTVDINLNHIGLSLDVNEVVEQSDILIVNTPAAYLQSALTGLSGEDFNGKIVVSAIKGIVPDHNQIVGDFLHHHYGIPMEHLVVIGGPCHAEEVSAEKLSYLTIASKTAAYADAVAEMLNTHYIKTVISNDIVGVEYSAVLKNIYALAGGICHGLGFGDNFQAVLVSNALREMDRFVQLIDPMDRDIKRSGYLGDLLVTAYSQFSRNRTFGTMIGKGYSVKSAQLEMNMVAEGYYASACIQEAIHQFNVDMPICDTVYQILYKKQLPLKQIQLLAEKLS